METPRFPRFSRLTIFWPNFYQRKNQTLRRTSEFEDYDSKRLSKSDCNKAIFYQDQQFSVQYFCFLFSEEICFFAGLV